MKIAIVHDWLTGMRGGESCLEVLCELFPNADLYTLIHIKGSVSETIEKMEIKKSFIQSIPFAFKYYRHFLPVMPKAIESFDLSEYDLIVSSSHCVAKGVKVGKKSYHISYCHTPMRYIWSQYEQYFGNRKGTFTKLVFDQLLSYLRSWDKKSSENVNEYIANSNNVSKRIKDIYKRESEVIYPPVNVNSFYISGKTDNYYLIVSAFAPYKKIDIAIEAFNKLGYPLVVIGKGQDEFKLKSKALENIKLLGWVDNDKIKEYYSKCRALIFPGEEDFGIVPVEAQASGRPIIAFGKGGILETVNPVDVKRNTFNTNATGLFFYEQTSASLINAVKQFELIENKFVSENIVNNTLKFDKSIYKRKMREFINSRYEEFRAKYPKN